MVTDWVGGQVLDVNEHAPEFESTPYRVTVAENSDKGAGVVRVAAHDADRTGGGHGAADLRYAFGLTLSPQAANVFRIDAVTGWITTQVPFFLHPPRSLYLGGVLGNRGPSREQDRKEDPVQGPRQLLPDQSPGPWNTPIRCCGGAGSGVLRDCCLSSACGGPSLWFPRF